MARDGQGLVGTSIGLPIRKELGRVQVLRCFDGVIRELPGNFAAGSVDWPQKAFGLLFTNRDEKRSYNLLGQRMEYERV